MIEDNGMAIVIWDRMDDVIVDDMQFRDRDIAKDYLKSYLDKENIPKDDHDCFVICKIVPIDE